MHWKDSFSFFLFMHLSNLEMFQAHLAGGM